MAEVEMLYVDHDVRVQHEGRGLGRQLLMCLNDSVRDVTRSDVALGA
jgi:hypothetical protein